MQADARVGDTSAESPEAVPAGSCLADLIPGLRRLDELLQRAIVAAEAAYGRTAAADLYRGLYISPDEAQRLLSREPCAPLFRSSGDPAAAGTIRDSKVEWLKHAFALSDFDLDLILIALAPELDLRYGRLYAYLQDDVTRKRATVDLALILLCVSPEDKLARRAHFATE